MQYSNNGQLKKLVLSISKEEIEQAVDLLQLAYILLWKKSKGLTVAYRTLHRLLFHTMNLAGTTKNPLVEERCLEVAGKLTQALTERLPECSIDGDTFQRIAEHYGYERLFQP